MRAVQWLAIVLFAGACSAHGVEEDAFPVDDFTDGKADGAAPVGQTLVLDLEHAAFPDVKRPGAVVYIPHGFDATPPLNVVVYLHGMYNCATNVVRSTPSSCDPGRTPVRRNANLAAQMEASGKNAILVVPQLPYDKPSSAAGALGKDFGFYDLLDEVIGKVPALVEAGVTIADVDHTVVVSHSGGYRAAAGIAVRGGIWVQEVYLTDSFYGAVADYDAWINEDLEAYRADPWTRRFVSIYTAGAGDTLKNSQAMARRYAGTNVLDDRTVTPLAMSDYDHGMIFKRTSIDHRDVDKYYFSRLVATSRLPDKHP